MSGFKRFILFLKVKIQSAVVPDDAISLNIQTIDAADAKQKTIICCNISKMLEERWYLFMSAYLFQIKINTRCFVTTQI